MRKQLEWTKMLHILSNIKRGDKVVIYWDNGNIFKCSIESIDEMENEFEMDDPNYFEFFMVLCKVEEIISQPPKAKGEPLNHFYKVGELAEASIEREPYKIEAEDGTLLWQRGDNEGWSLDNEKTDTSE